MAHLALLLLVTKQSRTPT